MKNYLMAMLYLTFSITILISCNDNYDIIDQIDTKPTERVIDETDASNNFAKILSKAIYDENIRFFIKIEALKQVDNDYDVIYHYVKNFSLNNGMTFRNALAEYSPSIEYLDSITNINPKLTILVPSITEIFSAERWDIGSQIPLVAVRNIDKSEKLKTYGSDNILSLDRYKNPTTPVLVVKSNERLKSHTTKSLNDGNIAFLDESFNNLPKKTKFTNDNYIQRPHWDAKTYIYNQQEYELLFAKYPNTLPRDVLYYNIDPTKGKNEGTLNRKYREYITEIELINTTAANHILDINNPLGDWSDGGFEFQIDVFFLSREGTISQITKMIPISVNEIVSSFNGKVSYIFAHTLKTPIELLTWDMQKYGTEFKISISEYDEGAVVEKTSKVSSSFTSNFKADAEISIKIVKIGGGGGGSKVETKESSTKTTTTDTSDPLGEAIVSFYDPIYSSTTGEEVKVIFIPEIMSMTSANFLFTKNNYPEYAKWISDLVRNDPYNNYTMIYQNATYYRYNTGSLKVKLETRRI